MAAGVPCSPFRSATPHSTASRARRFPLQMIFNCSIFDGNHCSNLDGSGQLTFNTRKNRFRCYVCDTKGGVIDLVMLSQGWNFYESCQWLAHQFGIVLSNEESHFQQREIKVVRKSSLNATHYTLKSLLILPTSLV